MDCLQPPPTIFRILTHSIHVLSVPAYFIALISLIFVKSKVFTTYRFFLIWHVIENLCFEVYASFLIVPTVHPPFTLIRTTGLLSQFGISQMFQFYAFATAIEFNGLSVSEMFYFRYKAGLLNYREHRFTYYLRTFVYLTRFIAIFNICFCIFTIHDASEFQQNHKTVIFHNNPSLSFLNCSNLYLVIPFADYVSSIILTTWIVQTASLIASVPGTVVYISHNVPKSISAATWKIQQQLLLSLIIQTAIHEIMLGIPNAMFIYALFFGFTNEYIAYSSFVCLTYHGFVSTFAMIVFTRPLREYVLSAMKIRKASIGTGIVTSSKTTG
ncbi:CRE-SRH-19 protein [Caenorhabditis remanei]|uniref:CRE-SRH-19 protein n=1 Tax=Caenorhabditis remanei TaxID=31234 RepID=E3LK72_CAERE|nr:CRE-SRH-19 protein [Caenorhabditis remanei]